MNCPNCDKEMNQTSYIVNLKYECPSCGILHNSCHNRWLVPDEYKPTEKQKNTLHFINSRLGTYFIPITKRQCSNVIAENFEKAKTTPRRRRSYYKNSYSGITDDDCDYLGLDASMFY